MRKDHFRARKSNFSVTALKKSSNPGEINESLCKLRGLVKVEETLNKFKQIRLVSRNVGGQREWEERWVGRE